MAAQRSLFSSAACCRHRERREPRNSQRGRSGARCTRRGAQRARPRHSYAASQVQCCNTRLNLNLPPTFAGAHSAKAPASVFIGLAFDSTLGYPGEGPPVLRRSRRRAGLSPLVQAEFDAGSAEAQYWLIRQAAQGQEIDFNAMVDYMAAQEETTGDQELILNDNNDEDSVYIAALGDYLEDDAARTREVEQRAARLRRGCTRRRMCRRCRGWRCGRWGARRQRGQRKGTVGEGVARRRRAGERARGGRCERG